jgi:hypothetical protein
MTTTMEELAERYHWFNIGEGGVPELFLDHHALSTFRMCEAHFDLTHLQFYAGKGRMPWSLAFGIVFHKAVEYIYKSKATDNFNPNDLYVYAGAAWDKAELDFYSEHKTYQALGGKPGFVALLIQYTAFYSGENERMRPIATEVAFGKAKEAPLGEFTINGCGDFNFLKPIKVRCYLTGRIDFLMDTGSAIGPMDHKTAAFFKGNPIDNYEPQEGMTGYIYATQQIVKRNFPELAEKRQLDRMWMNFIQVKNEPDVNKRFKRIPLFKTPYQLEYYRLRQLSTFKKIFELVTTGRQPDWNTSVCNNYWHNSCQYRNVHRQGSEAAMFTILNQDFEKRPAWNPEECED